ncbi:MAG: ribbon-helix-helix protein, CopG family [Limisphaerales bacterium]
MKVTTYYPVGPRKKGVRLINVWLPSKFVDLLDECVQGQDTDRSKFIRQAIREKMQGGARLKLVEER